MADEKIKSFEQAKEELDRILSDFDRDQVNLDTLVPRLKRAKELIEFCTKRIKQVEVEAREIVTSIEPQAQPADKNEEPPF